MTSGPETCLDMIEFAESVDSPQVTHYCGYSDGNKNVNER